MSNIGEFFWGTTNTVLAGDLANAVSNAAFPWAFNGYSSFNGSGVYGAIQGNANTVFAGVQGESGAAQNSNSAGVRGLALNLTLHGVTGARTGAGANTGWGGLFQNDLGYTGFFGVASDIRIKKNIKNIDNAIDIIRQLRGVTYEHRTDDPAYADLGLKQGTNYGFIAQEIEKLLPELVKEKYIPHINETQRGSTQEMRHELLKTVSYIELIPILVEAIKQQQLQIDNLQKQLDEQHKK
ncbi:MAG: tail fiber domain-containing protein [Chitinophagales bacterium]|nr:tail fiber domain-containing protein [Chitinophagales bacterium]